MNFIRIRGVNLRVVPSGSWSPECPACAADVALDFHELGSDSNVGQMGTHLGIN